MKRCMMCALLALSLLTCSCGVSPQEQVSNAPETQTTSVAEQSSSAEMPDSSSSQSASSQLLSIPQFIDADLQKSEKIGSVLQNGIVLGSVESEEKDGWAIFYYFETDGYEDLRVLCLDSEWNIQRNFESKTWKQIWEDFENPSYVNYPKITYKNGIVRMSDLGTEYCNVATGESLFIMNIVAAWDGDYELLYSYNSSEESDYFLVNRVKGLLIQEGNMAIGDMNLGNAISGMLYFPEYGKAVLDMKTRTFTAENDFCKYVYDLRTDTGTLTRHYKAELLNEPLAESDDGSYAVYATNMGGAGDGFWGDVVLQNRATGEINYCTYFNGGTYTFTETMLICNRLTSLQGFDLHTGKAVTAGMPKFDYGTDPNDFITVGSCWDSSTRRIVIAYRLDGPEWSPVESVPGEICLAVFDEYGNKVKTVNTGLMMSRHKMYTVVTVGLCADGRGNVTVYDKAYGGFEDGTFSIM